MSFKTLTNQPMIRTTLTALALFVGSVPAMASPHEDCLKASDYKGCIEVQQNGGVVPASTGPLVDLRNAMKQVSSRLSSGTSLRDSSLTFQPVIDAHALVPADQQNTLAYQSASIAIKLFDLTQSNWQARISLTRYYDGTPYMPGRGCDLMAGQVRQYNGIAGKKAVSFSYKKKGLLGVCHRSSARPENLMYNFVIGVLRDGSTDPAVIKDYKLKRAEAIRLSKLGPWERHLNSRSGLREWANANPTAAAQEKAKFDSKTKADLVTMPSLPSSMTYLQGTFVEKYIGD